MPTNPSTLPADARFHIEVENGRSSLVSEDGDIRLHLEDLDLERLVRIKELAHNQYIRGMLNDSLELDVHRATLNHVCRVVERRGNPIERPGRAATPYARQRRRSARRVGRAA